MPCYESLARGQAGITLGLSDEIAISFPKWGGQLQACLVAAIVLSQLGASCATLTLTPRPQSFPSRVCSRRPACLRVHCVPRAAVGPPLLKLALSASGEAFQGGP